MTDTHTPNLTMLPGDRRTYSFSSAADPGEFAVWVYPVASDGDEGLRIGANIEMSEDNWLRVETWETRGKHMMPGGTSRIRLTNDGDLTAAIRVVHKNATYHAPPPEDAGADIDHKRGNAIPIVPVDYKPQPAGNRMWVEPTPRTLPWLDLCVMSKKGRDILRPLDGDGFDTETERLAAVLNEDETMRMDAGIRHARYRMRNGLSNTVSTLRITLSLNPSAPRIEPLPVVAVKADDAPSETTLRFAGVVSAGWIRTEGLTEANVEFADKDEDAAREGMRQGVLRVILRAPRSAAPGAGVAEISLAGPDGRVTEELPVVIEPRNLAWVEPEVEHGVLNVDGEPLRVPFDPQNVDGGTPPYAFTHKGLEALEQAGARIWRTHAGITVGHLMFMKPGSYSFTLGVEDAKGVIATQEHSFRIAKPAVKTGKRKAAKKQ